MLKSDKNEADSPRPESLEKIIESLSPESREIFNIYVETMTEREHERIVGVGGDDINISLEFDITALFQGANEGDLGAEYVSCDYNTLITLLSNLYIDRDSGNEMVTISPQDLVSNKFKGKVIQQGRFIFPPNQVVMNLLQRATIQSPTQTAIKSVWGKAVIVEEDQDRGTNQYTTEMIHALFCPPPHQKYGDGYLREVFVTSNDPVLVAIIRKVYPAVERWETERENFFRMIKSILAVQTLIKARKIWNDEHKETRQIHRRNSSKGAGAATPQSGVKKRAVREASTTATKRIKEGMEKESRRKESGGHDDNDDGDGEVKEEEEEEEEEQEETDNFSAASSPARK